jgi:hypothetical protein
MSKPPTQPPIDPDDDKVAATTLDFLLIELVPLAQRITERLEARQQVLRDEYKRSKIFSKDTSESTSLPAEGGDEVKHATNGVTELQDESRPITSLGFPEVAASTQDAMLVRLDSLGYRVGQGLVER